MIDLHSWPTSNGKKIHIMLEETGLPYTVTVVDIGRGDQFKPDFLKLGPNNKMPVIVDRDGPEGKPYPVFESGAILMYLAEKTGMLMPAGMAARHEVIQWLMFQMSGIGPMFGQCNHFRRYAREKIPYAIDRYTNECKRLYRVLNKRLEDREYVAGDYSIADIALYPWVQTFDWRDQDPDDVPHVKRWAETIAARPAVQKGMALLAECKRPGPIDAEHWENMYGATQYARR